MRRRIGIFGWMLTALTVSAYAGMSADSAERNFDAIARRNVFGLRPPPIESPSPKQPPQITLLGIMTFGHKRAALKIEWAAKAGGAAQAQYYILTEGESAGGIVVLAIDEKARRVRVNNEGTLQVLEFRLAPTR